MDASPASEAQEKSPVIVGRQSVQRMSRAESCIIVLREECRIDRTEELGRRPPGGADHRLRPSCRVLPPLACVPALTSRLDQSKLFPDPFCGGFVQADNLSGCSAEELEELAQELEASTYCSDSVL